jgi:Na+-driven multidrug efflux pump
MLNGPLFGKMLTFSLPIMALNLLQLLFSFTNMVVVGNFSGEKALAAVGATGALVNLLVTLFMGLSAGVSVVVAQEYGAGKLSDMSRTVHTSICISFVAGIVVMLAGQLFSKTMLEWMDTPPDIILQSELYLRIYFFSSPAGLVYNFGAAILRAVGDSRRPMYYLIAAGILNVILNLFLVIVLHMSVAGVAWATVVTE